MDKEDTVQHLEDLYQQLVINFDEWNVDEAWLIALENAVEELS